MGKYSFDKAMDLYEAYMGDWLGRGESKEKLAKKTGITRLTLTRWFKKAGNDLQGFQKRYGSAYVDMWVEGLDETIENLHPITKGRLSSVIYVPGQHFFVPIHYAPHIHREEWYRKVIEENGSARDQQLRRKEEKRQKELEKIEKSMAAQKR